MCGVFCLHAVDRVGQVCIGSALVAQHLHVVLGPTPLGAAVDPFVDEFLCTDRILGAPCWLGIGFENPDVSFSVCVGTLFLSSLLQPFLFGVWLFFLMYSRIGFWYFL